MQAVAGSVQSPYRQMAVLPAAVGGATGLCTGTEEGSLLVAVALQFFSGITHTWSALHSAPGLQQLDGPVAPTAPPQPHELVGKHLFAAATL